MDFGVLMENIYKIFPILDKDHNACNFDYKSYLNENLTLDYINRLSLEIQQLDILDTFHEMVWSQLCFTLRAQIVPSFWQHFEDDNNESVFASQHERQFEHFQKFIQAVEMLKYFFDVSIIFIKRLHQMQNCCIFLDNNDCIQKDIHKFHATLREALLGQLPSDFMQTVYSFYEVFYRLYSSIHQNADVSMDGDTSSKHIEEVCSGCYQENFSCRCQELIENVDRINGMLLEMELLDRIAGQSITNLVQKLVRNHIHRVCQGIFDRSHLKSLESWLQNNIITWLSRIFNQGNYLNEMEKERNIKTIQGFELKLMYFVYEYYGTNVINQIFNIIIDFPDSIPAIDDLKICMEKIDMHTYLINTLKTSLESRILHPGVNTIDILTGYVAAIKSIRHLDNSGIILNIVAAPIKEYLRKRNDTVRRVVTSLTEEGPTDLSEELAKSQANKDAAAANNNNDDWESWQPDPFRLDQNVKYEVNNHNTNRMADIISMVVDIYGSKELFMNEYRSLMADRLLSQLNFNPEKEIRNLELLKLRFGETLLHSCVVMLKDVSDSKRINSHILGDTNYSAEKQFDISALIISAQFWPSFNKESLELPEEIANEFAKFTKSYESYKGKRSLCWRHVTGKVTIELELGEQTIELNVTPTQAVIIYHFQDKTEWNLEDLSSIMKVPASILRRRIVFWQTRNIIREINPGVYKLIEDAPETNVYEDNQPVEEDMESAMASTSDQREEELQVFWSYIVGMLTNLDSLSLDRIHQMLKLFASHGIGVEFSQAELKEFLQRKVREHKLIYSGGVYQLVK